MSRCSLLFKAYRVVQSAVLHVKELNRFFSMLFATPVTGTDNTIFLNHVSMVHSRNANDCTEIIDGFKSKSFIEQNITAFSIQYL